jgi:uracil-DNA glycosylase
MYHQPIPPTFDAWRDAARTLLARHAPPEEVLWSEQRAGAMDALPFYDTAPVSATSPASSVPVAIPRSFIDDAKLASHFRDESRWSFLYRLAFRLTHGEPNLMAIAVDEDVSRLRDMAKAVRRDNHKMHAFVRFRRVIDDVGSEAGVERYVAFHRPDHLIVPLTAQFFVERFRVMKWVILTPDQSVEWDGTSLQFGPGVSSREAPTEDAVEALWLTYYRHIFNPARLKVKHMIQELPKRHWRTLPEAALIPELIQSAEARSENMQTMAAEKAKYEVPPVPESRSLNVLRAASKSCLACPWACKSTQTVFGYGPAEAKIVLVGEQPGDSEDRDGKPFVGPAGKMLRAIIEETGFDAEQIYFTNAVKHFKFEERGTRRIHQTPSARDVSVCKPWLVSELEAIKPQVLMCLGATAAKSVLGNGFRITQSRGEVMASTWCDRTLASYHPSAILRVPEPDAAEAMREALYNDLKKAFALLVA